MFVSDHPSFKNAPSPESLVWRYMDVPRFLSLLEDESLYFARADQMSDKWEGAYGPTNHRLRPVLYGKNYEQVSRAVPHVHTHNRLTTHMSCWHESPYESAAMWDIYQREGRGVAIQSNWGALTASIRSNRKVYGARIRYVDYASTFIPEGNAFDAMLHKRLSFKHESEVRLLMATGCTESNLDEPGWQRLVGPEAPALPVEVNLRELIQRIFVAPDAPQWIVDLVQKVVVRYGFDFEVIQSDLASAPIL